MRPALPPLPNPMIDPLAFILCPPLGVLPVQGGLRLRHGTQDLHLTYAELDALVQLLAQLAPGRTLTLDTRHQGPVHLRHQAEHVQLQAQDFLLDCPPHLHWLPYTFCFLAALHCGTPREGVLRRNLILYCAGCLQDLRGAQVAGKNPRPEQRRATPEA